MLKNSCWIGIVFFLLILIGQKIAAQDLVTEKTMEVAQVDSIGLTTATNDSTLIKSDSTRTNAIDAPVLLAAKDSMRMTMRGKNLLFMHGAGSIKYKDINLDSEFVRMNADSSGLYATFGVDSIGDKFGYPVFKDKDQQTEMEELWYNFKTQKMFTRNAITQQGEGFLRAGTAKKMPDDSFNMLDGKYTTCDDHEHPHFYFKLTKFKLRPGKDVITGPMYLVVEDVPLPIAVPFGFFPMSKTYSSGILMPTYGDEMVRGFSLRDGGYYFAFSDHVDLALTGEIYTKGSWGLSARSKYVKRYKFSGDFNASYLVTVNGDKDSRNSPNSDYSQSKDIRVNWSHRQDAKANPYGIFSANVQFSTSSYNRNNFQSSTLSQMSENTKASSISYSYRSPTLPLSINTTASVNQRSKDSTLTVSLPDVTISLSSIYPFKRKEQIGSERWYEKILLTYTGTIKNSINDVKEDQFFKKSLVKDWKNGMKHSIPVSASFNFFKYIKASTSVNYNENWLSNRTNYGYDYKTRKITPVDTTYGFFRTYNYNASVSLNTTLYGMFKPWAMFGKWTKGVNIRHAVTPSVTLSGAPDFSDPKYGMYKTIIYRDIYNKRQTERYSIYGSQGPSAGRSGTASFSLTNNVEMKTPIAGTDSSRKVSLIDNLGLQMSYNFLADSLNWSNLSASIRLKVLKSTLSFQGNFDTYLYGENGRHINVPRWKAGKGLGRFMGTSTGYNYSISNETLKKLFKKGDKNNSDTNENSSSEITEEENLNDSETTGQSPRASLLKSKKNEGDYDENGYLIFDVPWTLSANYSVNLAYDTQHFDAIKREYPYKISQTLGFSGDISPTKNWRLSFNASYDFDVKRVVNMYCTISRQMHCWSMSASVVPIGPYQNYSFTIVVNSSLLQDVKYSQSSNSRDAVNWGNGRGY